MKKLEAIFDSFELHRVKAALTSDGVAGLTVSEVKTAEPHGHVERYRGAEYHVDWSRKSKIELLVRDEDVEYVVAVIRSAAHSTHGSNGTVSIAPVQEAVRIRTGQRDYDAL